MRVFHKCRQPDRQPGRILGLCNVLQAAFVCANHKSAKKTDNLHFRDLRFRDLRLYKLLVERWWNWHLVLKMSNIPQRVSNIIWIANYNYNFFVESVQGLLSYKLIREDLQKRSYNLWHQSLSLSLLENSNWIIFVTKYLTVNWKWNLLAALTLHKFGHFGSLKIWQFFWRSHLAFRSVVSADFYFLRTVEVVSLQG